MSNQRLTMLLASCGYPKDCPFCLVPIRVMHHLVGADVNYDFAGPNEGSPHECEMEQTTSIDSTGCTVFLSHGIPANDPWVESTLTVLDEVYRKQRVNKDQGG